MVRRTSATIVVVVAARKVLLMGWNLVHGNINTNCEFQDECFKHTSIKIGIDVRKYCLWNPWKFNEILYIKNPLIKKITDFQSLILVKVEPILTDED